MVSLRRATVAEVREAHPGLLDAVVELDGARAAAVAYPDLTGPLEPGDVVVLNTTAVELGLGTGGVHFVVAVEGREHGTAPAGHAMKARYTPHQVAVAAVEEARAAEVDAIETLDGTPVVAAGLHSALPAVALGARAVAPDARIAYVMTDGAALPLAFSRTVRAMREAGLLDATITCGQAFGGDLEAVSVYGALAAAVGVAHADLVVVAMGPGNLGTASRLGFASIEVGAIVNAVASLGGDPIVAARISFADPRERHHGLSHHTVTALAVAARARATIALPRLDPARARAVRARLEALGDAHDVAEVDLGAAEDALRASPVPLRSMGRGYDEDPDFFRAAAAAGVLAARRLTR